MIHLKPARERRVDLARWASPLGINTSSAETFGIPDEYITEIPEFLLIGSTLDDQPYVSDTANS